MRPLTTLVLSSLLAPTAHAQLAISEVLLDPVGPNDGRQIVEVVNVGSYPIVPEEDGLILAIGLHQVPLSEKKIPSGAVVRLHIGAFGPISETDHYLPTAPSLEPSGTLSILGPKILDSGRVIDFVSWGGDTVRIREAVASLQWESTTSSVASPTTEGHTIAWFGKGNASTAWFQDSTPTLGSPNDGARYGRIIWKGCPGSVGTAGLQPAAPPWTGEDFTVAITNLPSSGAPLWGVLATGFEFEYPGIDLTPFGLTGCRLHVKTIANTFFTFQTHTAFWSVNIPHDPALAGLHFYNQALIQDPGAPNPHKAVMSDTVVGVIGVK